MKEEAKAARELREHWNETKPFDLTSFNILF